jgi:hypothetical protein
LVEAVMKTCLGSRGKYRLSPPLEVPLLAYHYHLVRRTHGMGITVVVVLVCLGDYNKIPESGA